MNITAVRRVGRVAPALNTDPGASVFSSDVNTIPNDNTTLATYTVIARKSDGTVLVGATVIPTRTGTGTLSSPAVTDASGLTSFTFKSAQAATHTISITVNGIPVAQTLDTIVSSTLGAFDLTTSTVTVAPSSLAAGAGSATATLQGKDASGNSLIADDAATYVISIAAGGATAGATAYAGNGQWTCSITANTADSARVISATRNAQAVTSTTTFTVTAAYLTADLHNAVVFLTGGGLYDGDNYSDFHGNSGQSTPDLDVGAGNTIARDQTHVPANIANAWSVKRHLPITTGSGGGWDPSFAWNFGAGTAAPWHIPYANAGLNGVDRLYSKFWFYLDAAFDGILKFYIMQELGANNQYGGIYLVNGFLSPLIYPEWTNSASTLPHIASTASLVANGPDNGGHWLEFDYIRTGHSSGQPALSIWLNGVQQQPSLPSAIVTYGAAYVSGGVFDGYLLGGPKSTVGDHGVPWGGKIGYTRLIGQLNDTPHNSVETNLWVSGISESTVGRIG